MCVTTCVAPFVWLTHVCAACTDCPSGTSFTDATAADLAGACTTCVSGKYSGPASPSCTACAAGKKLGDPDTSDESTACTSCSSGKYSELSATSCSDCDAGTFSASPSSPSCDICGTGQHSGSGASECQTCGVGKALVNAAIGQHQLLLLLVRPVVQCLHDVTRLAVLIAVCVELLLRRAHVVHEDAEGPNVV